MSPTRAYYEPSEEELDGQHADAANRKRSSRACDQCRKTKSKCERPADDDAPCKTCVLNNTQCTFLGPSYKRGPPKGYIHAIEQRWHHVESILGAILASPDARAQGVVADLRRDDLAREILNRVDAGPFGTAGRTHHPGRSKEDYFASLLGGGGGHSAHPEPNGAAGSRAGRSRRESRVSREIVSNNQGAAPLPSPTPEWQDRLSASLGPSSGYTSSNSSNHGHTAQKRRLDGPAYDWDGMYTLEGSDGAGTDRDDEDAVAEGEDNATAMGQLSLDENREVRYHGKASGLHLLQNRLDDRKEGGIWKLPMTGVWPQSNIRPHRLMEEDELEISLPSVPEQDILIQLYFVYVHPVFPIIHKEHFLAEYEAKKTGSPVPDGGRSRSHTPGLSQVSKVLLLAMYALASRYLEQPPAEGLGRKMWEIGCNYALDAREILNKIYHHSRPSTCQALLLLGMHELGIGSMEHAWLFVGMATRMAEDLGLNRAADRWKYDGVDLFTPVEVQIRRVIWFVSVYMGRPVSIAKNDFDTSLPEIPDDDDDLWQPHAFESFVPNYQPMPGRIMECYREASTLVLIVAEIVRKIYPVKNSMREPKRARLAELETALDQWYIDLPETLRFDSASKRATPPPHVLLLHVRYWSAVLLLHRAFIPRHKGSMTSRSVTDADTVSLKAFDICQSAASHISTIVAHYDDHFGMKRSPLFLSSYVLSAGIMHVVTLNLRQHNVQATLGLRQCLVALEKMEVIWPSASRAKDLLNGANVQFQGILTPLANGPDRHKRTADDALGDDKTSELLQREAFGTLDKVPTPPSAAGADQRIMAHMLGLDIPGVQASTSYFPGYEWWPSIAMQQQQQQQQQHMPAQQQQQVQQHHALQAQQQHQHQHQDAQPRMQGQLAPMMQGPAGQQTPMQHNWMSRISSPTRGYPYENGLNGGYQYGR